ncbi:hypothetical protein L0V05_09465 [Tabrizicola sp. J26]|uniref:hypothetical protein n=1 Tax=Alitabrizicola rongguiensis TaxID=2909234 RepID=UPI001F18754B|nr:hypothetical protein [Tabrizicola rongguiensis]MCF1709042.1 hypothetical protein [Tabrizicola rongguiensis]
MVGASKILTVSYGTFSCTLEGFDDPFNTMKAIAEYFRDLAADDRYFGAEPPTPDAAMLHRIAEREIQRRVEAKVDDHGVVLRASDLAPQPVAQPAAAPAPQPAPSVASPGLLSEESVAAKLQRIRSAVARAAAAPAPVVEDAVYAEDLIEAPAPVPAAAAPEAAAIAVEVVEEVAVVSVEPDDEPEAVAELSAEEDLPELAPAPEVTAEPEADDIEAFSEPDPVEEEALIAALSGSNADAVEEEVFAEETPVEPLVQADEQNELDQDDLTLDTLSGILADLSSDVAPGPTIEAKAMEFDEVEDAAAAETDEFAEEDEQESRWLDAVEMDAEDAEPSFDSEDVAESEFADTAIEAEAEESSAEEFPEDLDEDVEAVAVAKAAPSEEVEEPSIEDKLRRARARVIRVRRPDTEASAVVEEPAARGEGRTILETHTKGDEDVTRLLRQTNTEMDVPENRRRMLTLSHLKAAVAATVADLRSAGKSKGDKPAEGSADKGLDSYRADLASVVRPRRPTADRAPTDKPAPLVLVSEQRIDAPRPVDAVGNRVVPRRVTAGNLAVSDEDEDEDEEIALPDAENIFAQSSSFAEFAERLGATEIPDLLEAAAAYTACFEGRPHFSRPHLLRYVATLPDGTEINRETGLRSFGTLLRQGKIEKVKRGQFAITDNSYYLAEARRMVR